MIIRLLHLKVYPGKQDVFKRVLELLIPYSIRSRSGMVALYLGQLPGSNSQEFVLVTVWKDQETMIHQTRRNWTEAVLPPEALPLVEEWHVSDNNYFGVMDLPLKSLFVSI